MKKIINGKLYDTATAKEIGSWRNDGGWRDFTHMEETLYRKRTGEYFLRGEGGPMTPYSRRDGSGWTGDEKIVPLSAAQAREWAEEKLSADEYAEIFGLPDEGSDEKVTLCIQIPADLDAVIRSQASEQGLSLTAYITQILINVCK